MTMGIHHAAARSMSHDGRRRTAPDSIDLNGPKVAAWIASRDGGLCAPGCPVRGETPVIM